MNFSQQLAIGFGGLFVLVGIGWFLTENDYLMQKEFAPKYEQVRRDTFKQSQAYNEGMAQELRRYQMEYIKATPEQKTAIRSVVLQQFSGYDSNQLPSDCNAFMNQIKKESGL